MASAGNDKSEGPASGHGGDGGDWTNWLRSRLERVAAPEQRQDVATDDERNSGQDRPGTGAGDSASASAPPAPSLPPSEQEPRPDLSLRLQWPSHPLEPSAAARGRTADDRRADADTAGGDPPVAPASPEAPPRSDAPAPAQERPLPRIDAPVARSQAPPARPDAPVDPSQTSPARPEAPAPGRQGAADERPARGREAAPARHEAPTAPPGARALSGLAEPLAAVPAHELVAGLDRLQVAVSSLSARVDGLADATLSFRSVMNERLDEYTETVLRAAKSSAADVQEYRRMHTASIGELRRNANDTAETLRRLTGWMEELARIQDDDERWATALSQAFEEAAAGGRQGEERFHEVVSSLTGRLERIEAALDELAAKADEPAEPTGSSLAPGMAALSDHLERIDHALARLAEELAAEPLDPLLPVVTSLAERLERMEEALDGLAAEADQPPLPPASVVLDDDDVRAIAAAVAERLDAPPPAAPGEPGTAKTASARRTPDSGAAPAAPARSRRTTPIRAPSRSRSGR
ncbi:MAG TPA: hypothetical protein VGV63_06020 [Acidimicrobiales bacterium]|nr:hypothetical protein [Acidimicrobiales bacterium]